jgi:hypothetical protein
MKDLKLENKFSVALQTIPIDIKHPDDRLNKIKKDGDVFASSPDYQINYFMMFVVAAILPDWILRKLIVSRHATVACSNLPGPNFPIKIDGFKFENVGFFIPNVNTTALGLTILSYDKKLQFGIIADQAAISNEKDLEFILKGMINELYQMGEKLLR